MCRNIRYIKEIYREPDIYISVDSPTPILGKIIFQFDHNENFSNPLQFHVGLLNRGDLNSYTLNSFFMIFDKNVKVKIDYSPLWIEKNVGNFPYYAFLKSDLTMVKGTKTSIGNFKLSIPKKNEQILIAMFFIEGDFPKKSGLIYYDYGKQQYFVNHSFNHEEIATIWNTHKRLNQ